MNIDKPQKANRRKFFSIAGKSSLGLLLLSSLPIKLFGSKRNINKLKEVNPHPQAVKRVK